MSSEVDCNGQCTKSNWGPVGKVAYFMVHCACLLSILGDHRLDLIGVHTRNVYDRESIF